MKRNIFLRIETRPEEELPGKVASEDGLIRILDQLYDNLRENEAVELHIYRQFILVGTRKKGHDDKLIAKFTNFGLSEQSGKLSFAIQAIYGESLPEYCYKAISGDASALRQTTESFVRAYDDKICRMKEKGRTAQEIEAFVLRRDAVKRRLELGDEELIGVSEPIILEIPKDPDTFYSEDDVYVAKEKTFDDKFYDLTASVRKKYFIT